MSGKTWRSAMSPALVLAMVLGGPALVHGQLLPNRTIRRERPPCIQEPPFYPQVRQQYFGYYPTCWRKFPPGWACPCPNPELPNWQASLKEYPLDRDNAKPTTTPKGDDPADVPDRGGANPATESLMPPLPSDSGSPFEDKPKPDTPPTLGDPALPRRPAPRPGPAGLPPGTSVRPAPALGTASEVAAAQPAGAQEDATAPADPPPLALTGDDAAPAAQPLAAVDAAMPDAPPANLPLANTTPEATTPTPAPLPPTVQAPARRSLLGNLFGRSRRR